MHTIEHAVTEAMTANGHRDYIRYADQPIAALVEREQGIAQGIIEAAEGQGLEAADVRELLTGLNMHVATPEVEAENTPAAGVPADVNATLADIQRTLQAVLQAARDNGITIRV